MFKVLFFLSRPLATIAFILVCIFNSSLAWALSPPILHTELLEFKSESRLHGPSYCKLKYEARFYPEDCVELWDLATAEVVLYIGNITLTVPIGKLKKSGNGYRYVEKDPFNNKGICTLQISPENRISFFLSGKDPNLIDPFKAVHANLRFVWPDIAIEFVEEEFFLIPVQDKSNRFDYLYWAEPGPDCRDLCPDEIAQPINLSILSSDCTGVALTWELDEYGIPPSNYILYIWSEENIEAISIGNFNIYWIGNLDPAKEYAFWVVGTAGEWGCESFPSDPLTRLPCVIPN